MNNKWEVSQWQSHCSLFSPHANTAFPEPLPGACGKIGRVRSNLCDTKIGWKINGLQALGTFQERGFEAVEIRSQLTEPHWLSHKWGLIFRGLSQCLPAHPALAFAFADTLGLGSLSEQPGALTAAQSLAHLGPMPLALHTAVRSCIVTHPSCVSVPSWATLTGLAVLPEADPELRIPVKGIC